MDRIKLKWNISPSIRKVNFIIYWQKLKSKHLSLKTTQIWKRLMDNLYNRLDYRLTSDPGKKNEIFCYSWKENPKISKIAKFDGEML